MLRKEMGRNHLIAIVVVFGICFLALGVRAIIRSAAPREKVHIVEAVKLSDISLETAEQEIIPKYIPPPVLKNIIKFTPPVIRSDETVKTEDEIATMDEFGEAKITSTGDSIGTDTGLAAENGTAMGEGAGNPFLMVEQMPEFPGGEAALRTYLMHHIRYPAEAQAKRLAGTVFISFVVGKDGSIKNIRVLSGFDKSCEDEAIRVFSQMPKWNPGKQRGKPVYVQFTIPLRFNL